MVPHSSEQAYRPDLVRAQIQLSQVARRLNATSDPDEIADLIYRYARKNFGSEISWLLMIDQENQTAEYQTNRRLEREYPEIHAWLATLQIDLTPEAGLVYTAVQKKRNVYLTQMAKNFERIEMLLKPLDREFVINLGLNYILYVPLILDREVVGLLGLTNQRDQLPGTIRSWRDRSRHLRLFCAQAGAALHRARLAQSVAENQQRLATIGSLAAGLIHDLKNPISAITSYAELAGDEQSQEKRHDYLQVLTREAERLADMIHDIQDFSRGAPMIAAEPADLGAMLDDLLERVGPELEVMNIRLETRLDFRERVLMDRRQLRRVLDNLITNAREALNGRPGACITLQSEAPDEISYRITVRDNGPGIPQKIRETLFEPLVTAGKKGGTGMGLWNVKKIVEGHRGTVRVESQSGRGAAFHIDLPRRFDRRQGPTDRRTADERRGDRTGRRSSD